MTLFEEVIGIARPYRSHIDPISLLDGKEEKTYQSAIKDVLDIIPERMIDLRVQIKQLLKK